MSETIRPDAIYVRRITRRAFFYVPLPADTTIDGLIDTVLMEWLTANHPKVLAHIEKQQDDDKQFREQYQKPPPF